MQLQLCSSNFIQCIHEIASLAFSSSAKEGLLAEAKM